MHPYALHSRFPKAGEMDVEGAWGIHWCYPEGNPGPFPIHSQDKIVVKDIEEWKEDVKAPSLEFSQEEWDMCKEAYDSLDRKKAIGAIFILPGVSSSPTTFAL